VVGSEDSNEASLKCENRKLNKIGNIFWKLYRICDKFKCGLDRAHLQPVGVGLVRLPQGGLLISIESDTDFESPT
jgi:hypothetical protein